MLCLCTGEVVFLRAMKNTRFSLLPISAYFAFLLWCCVRSADSQCETTAIPCPAGCNLAACCFSMLEEEDVGTVVGNVKVNTLINDVLTNGSGSISMESDLLEMNETSGEVSVKSKVDREAEGASTCIVLSITVNHQPIVQITQVGVIVQDINDNPPVFTGELVPYSTQEGTDMMRCVRDFGVEAVDSDNSENALISYSLSGPGSEKFRIEANDNNESCIVNTEELDREAVSNPSTTQDYHIHLNLTASDGELSSSTILTITVTDINDNKPMFTAPSLELVKILENATNGDVIRDLNATDLDFNNTLTFSLGDESSNKPFTVNSTTGEVLVDISNNRALTVGPHVLKVTVWDNGGNRNESTLTVNVQDINDKFKIVSRPDTSTLVEGTIPKDFSITFLIRDKDTEENHYELELSGDYSDNFMASQMSLHHNLYSLKITVIRAVDQEAVIRDTGNNTIELLLTIQEIGPFKNFTHEETVNITVIGTNDNLPYLQNNEFILEEDQEQNIDLVLCDADSGLDGVIASSCVESALASLGDPVSSTDVTAKFEALNECIMFQESEDCSPMSLTFPALDRENGIDYVIVTLNVTDGGHRSVSLNLTIHLRDINDNCPVFTEMENVLRFNESAPPGVKGHVRAVDSDIGTNAEVIYELESQDLFKVDPTSGEVSSTGEFDREDMDTYNLMILVRNMEEISGPEKCDWNTITLTVEILDVNDNKPELILGTTRFSVFSDSSVGHLVTTITASDMDLDSTITYQIEPNDLFAIESTTMNTAIIEVAAELSDKVDSYNLLLTASDGEHTTSENITIEVKTPEVAAPLSPVVIGSTIGVCILLVVAILIVTFLVLFCVFLDKRRRSVKLSKHSRRSEIDGSSPQTRSILRQIPSSVGSSQNSRTNSANGSNHRVKFNRTVEKIDGIDSDMVTQSVIHLDSSGDESPVTPPRLPTVAPRPQHNGKLPTMDGHHHVNGVSRLPPIHEGFLFAPHNIHRSHIQDEYYDDSDGNSEDDESTLPDDNASSKNAPLPNTRHLSHMASSPHTTSPVSHLGPHLPIGQISPSHQFSRPPDHGAVLDPPQIDDLSIHSSSSESLTSTPMPVHSHLQHDSQRLSRPPGRRRYPAHMPGAYDIPPSSSSRYGVDPFGHYGGTDFGDASTYTSADLDDALHFNPDQEPGIFSLTATSSYDEESQL